jgi:hypothetical protein
MTNKTKWHRIFGLTLIDYFTGSNYHVDLEKELTEKKQYLDVLIIEQSDGQPITQLPDGLENLAAHNLLTYKSLAEPLNAWALEELIGHYASYRKQISPSKDDLFPRADFKLYAVSTRYPHNLSDDVKARITTIQSGVYDIQLGIRTIRLIVLSRMPKAKRNAIWHLFNAKADSFVYGNKHYDWQSPAEKAALNQLYDLYQVEGVVMSYTWEDFEKDYTREHLHLLPQEDLLKAVTPEAVLKHFSVQDLLKGLIQKGLPLEAIEEYFSKHQK